MKKILKKIIFASLILFLFVDNITFAVDEIPITVNEPEIVKEENINPIIPITIHLKIETPTNSIYNKDIQVVPCDSDNDINTSDNITAYCAILETGLSNDWSWWGKSSFLNSVNDITGYTSKDNSGNDVYHYWSWSLNGDEAMVALNDYELQPSDLISLIFIDPISEIISEPEVSQTHTHHSSGSSVGNIEKNFSIDNALSFLSANQKDDGSFGEQLYTDWVAIAVTGIGDKGDDIKNKIFENIINQNFLSQVTTDNERHAMALMSLGINPYNGTKIDYIKKITDSYDGEQLGDNLIVSDDIFGILILSHAGFTKDNEIIKNVVAYIISQQSNDGSFGSVDMTGAFIQVLNKYKELNGVNDAITKALNYIISNQNTDGGFYNSSSTSWALQALVMDNSYENNINQADKYLAENQKEDGGMGNIEDQIESRVWSTSYAIPATLHLSWNDILKSFPVPEIIINNEKQITSVTQILTKDIKINNSQVKENVSNEEKKDNTGQENISGNLQANVVKAKNIGNFSNKSLIYFFVGLISFGLGGLMFRRIF